MRSRRERGKLGKREKRKIANGENPKKVFNTSIKRFWGFSKLERGKLEIQKAGREKLSHGFSWCKFHQVLSFTENIKVVLF